MRPHVIVPTRRNVRFHQMLAAMVMVIGVVTVSVSSYAVAEGGVGRLSPLAAVMAAVSCIGGIVMLRGLASTLAHQYRRLRIHGRKYPAERVAVEQMRRGKLTHFHVVVAQFRTGQGALQEALSETFDYDVEPLLDASRIEVIADPYEPALCVVANDSLPPRSLRQLSNAQRKALGVASRTQYLLLVIGSVVAVSMFVYGVVQLLRMRF
jgi:hypothetical protein